MLRDYENDMISMNKKRFAFAEETRKKCRKDMFKKFRDEFAEDLIQTNIHSLDSIKSTINNKQFQTSRKQVQIALNCVVGRDIQQQHLGMKILFSFLQTDLAHIQIIFDKGIISRLIQFSKQENQIILKDESIKLLSLLTNGNTIQSNILAQFGVLQLFIQILIQYLNLWISSNRNELLGIIGELVIGLGNFSCQTALGMKIIKFGVHLYLSTIIDRSVQNFSSIKYEYLNTILNQCLWTLAKLFEVKHIIKYQQQKHILKSVALAINFFQTKRSSKNVPTLLLHPKIMRDSLIIVSNCTNPKKNYVHSQLNVEIILDQDTIEKLFTIAFHSFQIRQILQIKRLSLEIISHIALQSQKGKLRLENLGIFQYLQQLIEEGGNKLKKQAILILLNLNDVKYGNTSNHLLGNDYFLELLFKELQEKNDEFKDLIIKVIKNVLQINLNKQIPEFLKKFNCFSRFKQVIKLSQKKETLVALLDCFQVILKIGRFVSLNQQQMIFKNKNGQNMKIFSQNNDISQNNFLLRNSKFKNYKQNSIAYLFIKMEIFQFIQKLQFHKDYSIYRKAYLILKQYFYISFEPNS